MRARILCISLLLASAIVNADSGVLTKIVDGDTVYFQSKSKIAKCRLEYLDTPESSNNRKNKKDVSQCKNVSEKDMKSAGGSATRHAKSLLKLNNKYEYDIKGQDHYGRSICVVHNGNKTFNEQMVIDGYASIFRYYMNQNELSYYESLLQKAKHDRVGLWKERYEVMDCLDKARQ